MTMVETNRVKDSTDEDTDGKRFNREKEGGKGMKIKTQRKE